MLQSDMFARVFMACSGNIYIVFQNKMIVLCTPRLLVGLLASPSDLISGLWGTLTNVARKVNPGNKKAWEIPGLTLAYVDMGGTLHCEFSAVFRALFKALRQSGQDEPLQLDIPNDPSSFENQKDALLYIFAMLSKDFSRMPTYKQPVAISEAFLSNVVFEFLQLLTCGSGDYLSNIDLLFPEDESEVEHGKEVPVQDVIWAETNMEGPCIVDAPAVSGETDKRNVHRLVTEVPKGFVTSQEFALLKGVKKGRVDSWISRGALEGKTIQLPNKRIYIDSTADIPVDGRTTRTNRKETETRRSKYSKKTASYKDTQERIQEDNIVTEVIRPYISNFKEAQYYRKNNYHEVVINGKHALIIDINPEYYCERLKKTNRQLIKAGKSPVLPDDDTQHYHLHHIGQKKESPLAIVPANDHNSKEFYSFFHPNAACEKDIHGREFEDEKKAFWLAYLQLYDDHDQNYKKIDFLNHRNRTPKNKEK